ncbi:MAG: D-alanyl-D-alanine carboxypeptidase [Ruminococcaceae bacterium]|nr:D-alanyl-D-alanine carboxypeptidase [Oscillospiraceae bacterium]
MKRIISTAICSLLLFCSICIDCRAINISAQSAVVIDGNSSIVVYEKDAHTRRGMASTTKIMTALVAIENCPLDKTVKIADEAIGVEGSSIYLARGEQLTMEQLLYALLLQSANDAATAIAIEVGGSVDNFANMMNEKAKSLGLCNTNFTNPHGLYDDNHYTTAYDLAIITKNALQNSTFKKIVSTKKAVIPLNKDEGSRVLVNHNKLLSLYDGAIGVKTGFTKKCGRCLVSAAERDGTTIIAVTLNAPNDWKDHTVMLDTGFESIITHNLAEKGSLSYKVPVVGGDKDYITVSNSESMKYTCKKDGSQITSELILDRFLFAPVMTGETVGQVIFYNNGEEIGRLDLVTQDKVEQKIVKKKRFSFF